MDRRDRLTVMPFLLAMIIAVAGMPTNVYQICRRGVGTLEVEPWLNRSLEHLCRVVGLTWFARLWRGRFVLVGAAALLALLAADPSAASSGGVLMAVAAVGAPEPTLAEVKAAIEGSNRAFEEFKRTNDERMKQIEARGVADPLLQQKLDKINVDLAAFAKVTDAFAALEGKVNKLAFAGGEDADEVKRLQAEHKTFALEVRSLNKALGRGEVDLGGDAYKAYKQAHNKYLRRGREELTPDEFRAMSVGSDPDGGYWVTPDTSGRMVTRRRDLSPIRQIAAVQSISSDKLEGTRDIEEVSGGGWVSETGSRSATGTPQIGQWSIPVHEQYENPGATQKMLDDSSVDVEAWLTGKVMDKMARREGQAFVTGTGVGQPRGYASYTTAATADGSRAWGELEHVLTGTNGGWGAAPNGSDKLIDLVHKFRPHFRQNLRWVMNRVTLGSARQLKTSDGAYVWLPSMQAGQPSSLLQYPITEAEDTATYTTTGALAVAAGDFQLGYQIVDRIGIRVLRDPYTNKPYVQFYTTARVGGDVIDFEAIKFLKFAA